MRELAQQLLKGVHLDKGHVLGEGAYGVVYRGLLGDSPVALKAIKAHSPEQQMELEAALLDEAAAWTTVHHPNVVQCYGLHKDASGSLYLVSELMDGSVEALLQLSLHCWPPAGRTAVSSALRSMPWKRGCATFATREKSANSLRSSRYQQQQQQRQQRLSTCSKMPQQ